jgi:transcriptional regulator with XRE-family HTH domain
MSNNGLRRSRGRGKPGTFAERFARLVKEFGSRYRLAKASGISESTLQQYAQESADLPPRADILIALARAANVSIEWLATGKGEMRPAGLLPGVAFADVVMVELRDIHASLHMQQIRALLPFSRWWLERTLDISEPDQLFSLEADQDLPPEIGEKDLLLVDRSAGKRLPRGEGYCVFSVPTGLTVRRVQVGLRRGLVVTGPGISEELDAMEIDRLLVGRVIWRGGKV